MNQSPTKEILVVKCGGASVATPRRMNLIAAAVAALSKRYSVVVVVSAMGDTTDKLIALGRKIHSGATKAELEALAGPGEDIAAKALTLAVRAIGASVVDLNTHQFRPLAHQDGRLKEIEGEVLVRQRIEEGKIVVVPGYKGVTVNGDIVILGRGASDLLAAALAGRLSHNAPECLYWKDVPGLSPVSPKYVPDAIVFDELTYANARELVPDDDGVLMARCITVAESHRVILRVELAPSIKGQRGQGTRIGPASLVTDLEPAPRPFTAIIPHRDCAVVEVSGVPNRKQWAHRVFGAVGNIVLGNVVQGPGRKTATIAFTVRTGDLERALTLVRKALKRVKGAAVYGRSGFAGLTLSDRRMRDDKGYMERVTGALGKAGVNIELISAPESAIHVTVASRHLRRAAMALATEFGLRRKRVRPPRW